MYALEPLSDPEQDAKLHEILEGTELVPVVADVDLRECSLPATIETTPPGGGLMVLRGITSRNRREDGLRITIHDLDFKKPIVEDFDPSLFNLGHLVPCEKRLVSNLCPVSMTVHADPQTPTPSRPMLRMTFWCQPVSYAEAQPLLGPAHLHAEGLRPLPWSTNPSGISDDQVNLLLVLRELNRIVESLKELGTKVENPDVQALLDRYAKVL